MLLARPFRCEDCVHRYFSFLWASGSNLAGKIPDAKSLVYRSSTAALHSADHRHRSARRKVYTRPESARALPGAPLVSSYACAIQQPARQSAIYSNGLPMRESPTPRHERFLEVLGVILEIKHQTS
jgi:hypothetical protein